MLLVDLADKIYRDLEDTTNISIPQIFYWLLNSIGQLNTLIATNFTIVNNEVSPVLGDTEANIYEYLYLVKYYNTRINTNLGAAAFDWSELSEGDSRIRKVSKNEIAKTYKMLRDAIEKDLQDLIFYYKQNKSLPSTVTGILSNQRNCYWWNPDIYNYPS